jgi:pimeloyl-ACP methyl ester carboxylesterase
MATVLVPGFMLDATLWDDVLPLMPAAQPVTFADLRTGGSIEAMAASVLAAAPPAFVLVGFSMGGYVAREMARMAPERVTALALIATSARPDQPKLVQQRVAAAQHAATTAFHGLARGALRASLHASRSGDTAMIERVRAMGARLGAAAFLHQSAIVRAGDVATLGQIRCPTLVIGADGDQLRSVAESQEQADGIPGAELAIVAGSGHMIPLEAPHALVDLLNPWLARAGAGR